MVFKDGEKILSKVSSVPVLAEGNYEALIKDVEFKNECKTEWGYRDFIEVTYTILVGITEQLKKEKIMISQSENSRCYNFLSNLYKEGIPDEIDIKEWIGKRCVVTIKHNITNNGNIYANIVERRFLINQE